MLELYLPIFILFFFAAAFGIIMSNVNNWFGPNQPTEIKLTTYESGMKPIRTARERVSVKYYMVAMLFIVFDIEVVFLYPWAVNFKSLGMFGFVEMFVFITILFIGYIYIFKKGALRWD